MSDHLPPKMPEVVVACLESLKREIHQLEQSLNPEHIDRILEQLAVLGGSANRRGLIDAQQSALSLVAFLQAIKNSTGLETRDCVQMFNLLDNLERTLLGQGVANQGLMQLIHSSQIADVPAHRPIGMLIKNQGLMTMLAKKLNHAGLETTFLFSENLSEKCLPHDCPAAMIVELNLADSEAFKQLRNSYPATPLLVIADSDDMQSRLRAVRLGGSHFFIKPVDTHLLIDTLRALGIQGDNQPYRALFIDDSRIMSVLYTAAMNKAGVKVQTLADPLMALDAIESFLPDVIITDLYMPGCSGLELAALLRQNELSMDIPLLFLSSETNIEFQMAALETGADDFLLKPVNEGMLQLAVLTRAKRGRELRAARKVSRCMQEHLKRIELAIDKHNIVSITDVAGNIVYVNQRFKEVSGYSDIELLQCHHRIIKSDLHPPAFFKQMWSTIRRGNTWHGEICNRRKDGSHFWADVTITSELDKYGLIHRYIAVGTDITAIKNMQDQLLIARDEAESASQAKSVFLAHMSHEFKTPLNSIIGFSQLLQNDPDATVNEDQREMLSAIERGGYHLLKLINDLVDQARIETGHLKLEMEVVELDVLVQECIALLTPQIQQRRLRLHISGSLASQNVFADRIRVKQVLLNLLSNAVKYNCDQGSVTIACERLSYQCRLSVHDSGQGIEAHDMAKLFQPFSRVSKSAKTVEGSGIGLALSKNLIERMNGEIGVVSQIGRGSEFWFTLPTQPQILC